MEKPEEVKNPEPETVATLVEHALRVAEEHAEKYKPVIDLTLNYFNYKQRRQYNIKKLKFIFVPLLEAEPSLKVSLVAFGGIKAKDMILLDTTVGLRDDYVRSNIDNMIAYIMRYGLKHLYINGVETTEDAFL